MSASRLKVARSSSMQNHLNTGECTGDPLVDDVSGTRVPPLYGSPQPCSLCALMWAVVSLPGLGDTRVTSLRARHFHVTGQTPYDIDATQVQDRPTDCGSSPITS